MKAIVITQPGAAGVLQFRDVEKPQPKPTEVLINIKAAGINRPDIAQRQGKYPPPPDAPQDIPGLEVAGIIASVGAEVIDFKAGDEVCALLAGGGYAEYAAVNAGQCLPLPQNWSFIEAASLPETVFTVWHNVFQRGKLNPGENFLVHGGSSGIGVTAIQIANAWGAIVYTTAGSEQKCLFCEDLGAKKCINYHEQDFEKELETVGIDVILDMIGGDYFQKNIKILNTDGRLVYINSMNGKDVKLDISQIMQKRINLTGSTLRNRDAVFKAQLCAAIKENVWPMLAQGKFKPIIYKTFQLADAAKAHQLMESSEHIGKIVLEI